MSEKYILIDVFDREIAMPMIFDTIEEAHAQMKRSLIFDGMGGMDDSIFDEFTKGEDYDWEHDGDSAWLNKCCGNSDWQIVSISAMREHTQKILKAQQDDKQRK